MPWFLTTGDDARGVLVLIAGIWARHAHHVDLTSKLSSVIGDHRSRRSSSRSRSSPRSTGSRSADGVAARATGLIFLGVFIALRHPRRADHPGGHHGHQAADRSGARRWSIRLVRLANRLGWHISADNLTNQIEQHAQDLVGSGGEPGRERLRDRRVDPGRALPVGDDRPVHVLHRRRRAEAPADRLSASCLRAGRSASCSSGSRRSRRRAATSTRGCSSP